MVDLFKKYKLLIISFILFILVMMLTSAFLYEPFMGLIDYLKANKEHFTLYSDEMQEWGWLDSDAEHFYYKVNNYLSDVLPDEGHPDWSWKNSDLKKACHKIFDIIKNLHKSGTTILLVEQNAQMALSIADRGYVMETGRIVTSGTGKGLLLDDAVKKAYLGA